MKLQVSSQDGTVERGLMSLVERQIAYALSRFESRIRTVTVRLSDLNGPKGGIDKHCRIAVQFRTGGSVTAEVTDVAFEPVIHRAVDRIARRVQRHWDLSQTQTRSAAAARKNQTGVGE